MPVFWRWSIAHRRWMFVGETGRRDALPFCYTWRNIGACKWRGCKGNAANTDGYCTAHASFLAEEDAALEATFEQPA